MSNLKITKFGTIHKDVSNGNIVLSDFELEGHTKGDTYLLVIDAVIEEFKLMREGRFKEIEHD